MGKSKKEEKDVNQLVVNVLKEAVVWKRVLHDIIFSHLTSRTKLKHS